MRNWAELIRSIAALLWPILAFVALCMFKQRIHEILGRLRRGKFLGQEIELEQDLRQLHETAQAAASETAQVVQLPSTADAPDKQKREAGDLVERVFEEASRNPRVALILLASELEREVRQLFASLGSLGRARPGSLPQSIRTLEENGVPPRCGAGAWRPAGTAQTGFVRSTLSAIEDSRPRSAGCPRGSGLGPCEPIAMTDQPGRHLLAPRLRGTGQQAVPGQRRRFAVAEQRRAERTAEMKHLRRGWVPPTARETRHFPAHEPGADPRM